MNEEEKRERKREQHRRWYRDNKEYVLEQHRLRRQRQGLSEAEKAQMRQYYHTKVKATRAARPKDEAARKDMLAAARYRARRDGVPFGITVDDIRIPDVCPVFGMPLVRAEKMHAPNSPSLDKFKPALGYMPGNIAVISFRANQLKGDATLEELCGVIDYVEGHAKSHACTPKYI